MEGTQAIRCSRLHAIRCQEGQHCVSEPSAPTKSSNCLASGARPRPGSHRPHVSQQHGPAVQLGNTGHAPSCRAFLGPVPKTATAAGCWRSALSCMQGALAAAVDAKAVGPAGAPRRQRLRQADRQQLCQERPACQTEAIRQGWYSLRFALRDNLDRDWCPSQPARTPASKSRMAAGRR